MGKKYLTWVAALIVLAGGGWVFHHFATPSAEAAKSAATKDSPGVPVTVSVATRRDISVYLQGLGTVQAYNTVTVRPQVDGQLRQVAFKEGQEVRAGDLLVQIDPRTFQAALDQAVAKKAQDEALLANARLDVQRYTALVEKNYVARQQLDTTRAQVSQLEATVMGDEAAIENARVTLGYTTIRSPIDGRVGIRQVDAGNIVHASDPTGIVVITQLHPISLLFPLPEDSLQRIIRAMAKGPLAVTAVSRDGKETLDEGQLDLVDNQIDQSTGTMRLKATMPNKANLLWPGQYLNAKLRVETLPQLITVPADAVQRGTEGAYAYVVKGDGTVESRRLTVGEISEGMAVIEKGIAEGEKVVVEGQYRLQPGARVEARIAAAQAAAPAAGGK